MTTPVRLKLIPRSTIKAKNITRLVGQVEAGVGATVTLINGNWVVALDGAAFQPLDADLTGLAAISGAGLVTRTAGNTYTTRTIAGTANEITVTDGGGVAAAPTISLPTTLDFTGKTITGGTFTDAGLREVLTGVRTYYVRTDGNDSHTGLTNTAGGAFLTIQRAFDVAATLDARGSEFVSINVADGTYTGAVAITSIPIGLADGLHISLNGNATTPANCIISTVGDAISIGNSAGAAPMVLIDGFEVRSSASNGIVTYNGGRVRLGAKMRYGACAIAQIYQHTGGYVDNSTTGGYSIVGSAGQHILSDMNGVVILHGLTNITITTAVTFSSFIVARNGARVFYDGNTFVGKANVTGERYDVETNATIITGTTSTTYLPGTTAGEEQTGGTIDCGSTWTAFTTSIAPTATPGTFAAGTFSGRYRLGINNTVTFQVDAAIVTNDTGSGAIQITVPFAAKVLSVVTGRERQVTGKGVQGEIQAGSTAMNVSFYDNNYPGADTARFIIGGTYERQ